MLENSFAVCEPAPVPRSGKMKCRRGQSTRTFQGQKPPTCSGVVLLGKIGHVEGLLCSLCGLTHGIVTINGQKFYGAML